MDTMKKRYGTEKEVEKEFPFLKAAWLRRERWAGGGPPFYKRGRSVWYELNYEIPAWLEGLRVENTSQYSEQHAAAQQGGAK